MFSFIKTLLNNPAHIKSLLNYLWIKISRHKVIAVFTAAIILIGSYYGYGKIFGNTSPTRYATAAAQKGTLIVSITGSGQVSASQQVDIKTKVSGDVVFVNVKSGQYVTSGTLIAQLYESDAQKTVRDAEINLESAKLSLEKLKQSSADVNKIKEDSFNTISNAFLNLPAIISGSETIINGSTLSNAQSNKGYYQDFVDSHDKDEAALFVSSAGSDYGVARAKYDETLLLYKNTSRYSDNDAIVSLLSETVDATKNISQALKSEQSLLDYLADYAASHSGKTLSALVGTYRSNLQTYIGQTNNSLSDLINIQNTIKNAPLDISSQELSVKQRENALLDAKEKLSDYYIRAPFSGVVAKLNLTNGDSVSSGFVAATFITRQKIAEISLNEIDVAQVKVGQKTTLTFDAVPGLSITGEVAEIDTIGTVTQGVVNYNVKIIFDTQDERVKPGMSVSAAIIVLAKPDVLLAPNSAVKQQGNNNYVEMPDETEINTAKINSGGAVLEKPLKRQLVEVGAVSDEFTEITSGLNEGDLIIIRIIQSNSTPTQAQSSQSGFRIPGLPSGGARSGGFGR